MFEFAKSIWRQYVTDGVPSTGNHKAKKAEIRAWGTWIEGLVRLAWANNLVYALKSELLANLVPGNHQSALVIGDPTPGNDGLYMKNGATTLGSWVQLLDFVPGAQIVHAVDIGAGTPNAIIVTTDLAVSSSGSQLVEVDVFEANSGTPVTITFPGLPAKTIKTSSGNDPAPGGIQPGPMLGRIRGNTFRLISDQAAAAILAAAEAILAQITSIVDGFMAFTTVNTTVTAGTMDTIVLNNAAVVKDQIWLYLDGVYQHRSTFNVAGGVITPTTPWPGAGMELNVEVGFVPAFGTPVIANAIVRANVNTKFGRGMPITPYEFDAQADGIVDNTAAMVAWRDACEDGGLLPSLPRGIFKCGQELDFSFGARIVGAGEGLTRVRFTNPASGGFKCQPDINSDPFGSFRIENLDIETPVLIAKAINVVLPDSGDFTNNFRVGFPNVDIYGIDGGYFQVGLYQKNIAYAESSRIRYWGSDENPTADNGYFAGVGCDLDTQVTADNPMLGLSLENIFSGLSVHFANTGVRVRNFTEGVHLLNCNIAFVRRGVDAVAPGGTRQPLVSIVGGHFNCSEYCVKLDGYNQSQIVGAHMSRPGGEFTYGWTGVHLNNSLNTDIVGGKILAETVATPSLGDVVGVRLAGDSWFCRIDTAFIGAISGAYKPMTKAIQIDAGVNGTKISPSNTYSGIITANIVDDSGNSTNVIATGLTIKEGVTTKGPTGGVTELNFADPDFNLNATASAVAVAAA